MISLKKLTPNIYQKDIYTINYKKLYKQGKRVILFDLDNTLVPYKEPTASKETLTLINKLKKIGFTIYIFSNSIKGKKVKKIAQDLNVNYNLFSLKPFKYSFKKIIKKYNHKTDEIVIIGDQLFTDVLGGNKMKITTILVTPASSNEAPITKFMRLLEKQIKKKGLIEENKYYD